MQSLSFIAKFNCTVPGTLYGFTECDITSVTTIVTPTDSLSDLTTTLNIIVTSIYTTLNVNPLHTDPEGIYVLAGLGGGILVLMFCIIMLCVCFCLRLARRKRQVLTFTAENVYTMEDNEQPQQQHGMYNKSDVHSNFN